MVRRASKTSNKNQRPNSYAGRALKVWMLAEFGDGLTVPCSFGCGKRLFYSEITKDRFPIPGRKGGRYSKGNVRPACMSCNAREGAKQAAYERSVAAEKRRMRNARRRFLYAQRKQEMSNNEHPVDMSKIDKETPPAIQEILAALEQVKEERKAADPRNIVFEYSPDVEASRAYFMKRQLFDDGRHRVIVHSNLQGQIEQWLASLPVSS